MWIQTGVTVRKRLSWVVTFVTLTFHLWPWPFAWTLLWSLVITPENFMMIRWWEHSQKGVTDRRTDGRTDGQTENTICRAAWSQLKMSRCGCVEHGLEYIMFYVRKHIAHLVACSGPLLVPFQWHHNGRDSVSNLQPHGCLLNHLFRRRSKKTSKLRVTGLCVGNSPGTGEFPAQMASYAENASIRWRHHARRAA